VTDNDRPDMADSLTK